MVTPTGKAEPLESPAVSVPARPVPSQLSAKVGTVYVTTASQNVASLVTVISAGQLSTVGSSLSFTVTIMSLVIEQPFASNTRTL